MIAPLKAFNENRPSIVLTNGKPPRSKETVAKILKAGRKIFFAEGHGGLTLRKISDAASISVGNLNYHFPTKRAILEAVLNEALADYIDGQLEQFDAAKDEPIDILLNVVEYYIRNARATNRFFFQMWGYAGCDEEAMASVRALYEPNGRFLSELVRAANPKLSDADIRRVVLQIFSLEVGYKLFIGMGPDDDSALQTAEQDIRALVKIIVFAPV